MKSHVTYISHIALMSTYSFDWASPSPNYSSLAAEIFHFQLIRIHSNARNLVRTIYNRCGKGARASPPPRGNNVDRTRESCRKAYQMARIHESTPCLERRLTTCGRPAIPKSGRT